MKRSIFVNLASILFAVFSVIYSIFGIRYEHKIKHQVRLINLPQDFVPVQRDISFSVEYSCSHILKGVLDDDQTDVNYDAAIRVRENSFFLININTSDLVRKVPFCKVVSVSPKLLNIELQRFMSKYLKVLPDIVGNVPPEYSYSFSVSPPYVMAKGPEGKLKDKEVIYTEVIDIQDRNADFSIRIPLRRDEEIELDTDIVFVKFEIKPK